jgi:Ribosomal protein L9, C-terminal domain
MLAAHGAAAAQCLRCKTASVGRSAHAHLYEISEWFTAPDWLHARALQVGEKDQIFGSVSTADIVEAIELQTGRQLDKKVTCAAPIAALGRTR